MSSVTDKDKSKSSEEEGNELNLIQFNFIP
jgi:hypothetical protein